MELEKNEQLGDSWETVTDVSVTIAPSLAEVLK